MISLDKTLRVFLPFAFGFYISYLYRSVNAIIAPNLIQDIGVDAADLGLLTSAYFISFAAFQIPLGIMLDRIGPRRIDALLLLIAAIGAGLFSISQTLSNLVIARALIGLGVSACLMASFKSFVDWFPKSSLPLFNGATMMAGGLGALTATMPIEFALHFMNWRSVFLLFCIITVISSLIIYFVVPEREGVVKLKCESTVLEQIQGLGVVITNISFLRFLPISITSQGSMLALQSLWIGPWLRDVGQLERQEVASYLFAMAIALTMGFLFWGIAGERMGRFGISPMKTSMFGMCVFLFLQFLILFEPTELLFPICILFGFFGTAGSLSYVGLLQNFPDHFSGRVYTSANLLVFLFAFLIQWGVGVIINMWSQTNIGGFPPIGYRTAFFVILFIQILALSWVGFSRLIWKYAK